MNKYNIGDKFIIEIAERIRGAESGCDRYRIKGFDSLTFDDRGLNRIANSDTYIQETYDNARQEGYEQGLNDAWEAAKRIVLNETKGGLEYSELHYIFCDDGICVPYINDILSRFSAQQVVEKLKEYDKKKQKKQEVKKIEVGSIWKKKEFNTMVIVCELRVNDTVVDFYTTNGTSLYSIDVDKFLKSYTPTGKNIKDLLQEGKEE